MLPKLVISPDSDGYAAKMGNPVVSTQLDGGVPRYRKDYDGVPHTVPVKWTVGKDKYDYLCAFFRTSTEKGSLPFLINLVIDSGTPTEYTVYFVPDTFQLESQSGLTYVTTATLLAMPLPDDTAADQLILSGFDEQLQ